MIVKILDNLKVLGYSATLEGDAIRLRYLGQGEHPAEAKPLIAVIRANKPQAVEYLRETRPLPYLDLDGSVVIPFGCDSRYHWWKGGQSTMDEI